MVKGLRDGVVTDIFRAHVPPESVEEQWDIAGLETALQVRARPARPGAEMARRGAEPRRGGAARADHRGGGRRLRGAHVAGAAGGGRAQYERYVLLQILDAHWREHLAALDHLRQGIHLRGYAQKNPKQEYKREAFELFGAMLETVKLEVTRVLNHLALTTPDQVREIQRRKPRRMRPTTCSTSTPLWRRRSSAPARKPRPKDRSRRCASPPRSCGRSARSVATIRARAARARSTSTATALVLDPSRRHHRSAGTDEHRLDSPRPAARPRRSSNGREPRAARPRAAGRRRRRRARVRRGGDQEARRPRPPGDAARPGQQGRGRVHPEPLLRRAGPGVPAPARRAASDPGARHQYRQRELRDRRGGGARRASARAKRSRARSGAAPTKCCRSRPA